jgi:hypothetical protein
MSRKYGRFRPYDISDPDVLSRLFDRYLELLMTSDYQMQLSALAYEVRIEESILRRLMNYHRTPADQGLIMAQDFHIAFRNIMVQYPTVRFWRELDGSYFIEI